MPHSTAARLSLTVGRRNGRLQQRTVRHDAHKDAGAAAGAQGGRQRPAARLHHAPAPATTAASAAAQPSHHYLTTPFEWWSCSGRKAELHGAFALSVHTTRNAQGQGRTEGAGLLWQLLWGWRTPAAAAHATGSRWWSRTRPAAPPRPWPAT